MGGNVRIDDATLRARALEIQKGLADNGVDFTSNPITVRKDGAIFTYTKGEDGKLHCSYKYHNETVKDVLLFERATVATSRAGLTYLNEAQLEEYKQNYPSSYLTTKYSAAQYAIDKKAKLEEDLDAYDKKTRKQAEKDYQKLVSDEIFTSGTTDRKTANKMAKYAMKDAKAGQREADTITYYDKAEYDEAKNILKARQKAAKKRINQAKKLGFKPNAADLELMEKRVEYIKDNDVRKYVASHKNIFNDPKTGKFSSERYHQWASNHLQGDNTLTTSESGQISTVTGLSKGDSRKAVKYAGYDAQKDYTLAVNLAKSAVGILAPVVFAALAHKNIHDVENMLDKIELVADETDPSKFFIFVDGKVVTEATSEVVAKFKNVAVRNALLGAVSGLLCNYITNPEKTRDKISDGITASTITTQNIFRGKDVVDINGNITIDLPDDGKIDEQYAAEIIEFLDKQDDCTVTFNIDAQKTGRRRTVNGKSLPEFKAHLWEAMYAAYNIPTEEQATFRKAYRAKYFPGKAYYNNGDNTTKCEFEYTYNGQPRKVNFDKEKFDKTWTYYTQKAGVHGVNVKEQGNGQAVQNFEGSASWKVDGKEGSVSTPDGAVYENADQARQHLQRDVLNKVANGELTPEQGQKAINEIQNAPVKQKKAA